MSLDVRGTKSETIFGLYRATLWITWPARRVYHRISMHNNSSCGQAL